MNSLGDGWDHSTAFRLIVKLLASNRHNESILWAWIAPLREIQWKTTTGTEINSIFRTSISDLLRLIRSLFCSYPWASITISTKIPNQSIRYRIYLRLNWFYQICWWFVTCVLNKNRSKSSFFSRLAIIITFTKSNWRWNKQWTLKWTK